MTKLQNLTRRFTSLRTIRVMHSKRLESTKPKQLTARAASTN